MSFSPKLSINVGVPAAELNGEALVVLTSEFRYGAKDGTVYVVPSGFQSDLATIPALLRGFVQPDNLRFAPAYVVHDYLYSDVIKTRADRSHADKLLDDMLTELGMSAVKRFLIQGGLFWHHVFTNANNG